MQKGGSTDERRRKNARTRLDAHTTGRANNSACVGGGTVPTVALQHEPELSEQETEPEPWQRWSCPQRRSCTSRLTPSGLATLTPQCGDRTASLLCLGLSRFEPSNEQPPSLPAFACLPAALPAAPRRLVCPRPALPFSSLCFSRPTLPPGEKFAGPLTLPQLATNGQPSYLWVICVLPCHFIWCAVSNACAKQQ